MTLSELQSRVVEAVRAEAWLAAAGLAVVGEDKGDPAAEVERALGALGACVVVMVGEFRPGAQDGGVLSGVATLLLQAVELPATNRGEGRLSALEIASRLAAAATGWDGAKCTGLRLVDAGTDVLAYEVTVEVAAVIG